MNNRPQQTIPRPSLEHELASRFAALGIADREIHHAIALIRSGRADLIQAVIDGALDLRRALQVARAPSESTTCVDARRHGARDSIGGNSASRS
jgi:hypothetical protein